MTTEHPPTDNIHLATGDEALAIIKRCRQNVDERFEVRPLDVEFPSFTRRLGTAGLYLAEADNNITGTFKWRGASVAAEMLYQAGKRSVVVYSAGNHSLGAAAALREYPDMYLDVFIPGSAPSTKQEGPKKIITDGRLVTHIGGQTIHDAAEHANQWLAAHPESVLLPPFDDRNVIRGQGTIAHDILALLPNVDVIVSTTGGGGINAGILQYLEEHGRTDIQCYGIEAVGSNSMSRSLAAGEVVDATSPNPRFDGSALMRIGEHVFDICKRMKNFHILTVTDQEIDELTDEYAYDHETRHISSRPKEPTTLLGVAALRQVIDLHPGAVIAVISTGHNTPLYPEPPQAQSTSVWSSPLPK